MEDEGPYGVLIHTEEMTPGATPRGGAGVTVCYGFHPTPFGECLIAVTSRGICHLAFLEPVTRAEALARLAHEWPGAQVVADQSATRRVAAEAFPLPGIVTVPALALHVRGTRFQLQVWRALLEIPPGAVTTYGAIAARIGAHKASRAVGTAVGRNPVSYLIPCHRVIRASGELGGYAWGVARKRQMLGCEVKTQSNS